MDVVVFQHHLLARDQRLFAAHIEVIERGAEVRFRGLVAVAEGLPVEAQVHVRAVVGHTATNSALALTYPSGWRTMGKPAEPHFSDETLIAHLAKQGAPEALRFRHWVEREIAFPAQRLRERLGIRPRGPKLEVDD